METSWRFRGVRLRYAYVVTNEPDGSRVAYALALTRVRRVRFFAFTLAR
jgi:hypothetical protein